MENRKEISCHIIRDILPLYLDGVVSDDTRTMVEEHLETCSNCQKEAALLQQNVVVPTVKNIQFAEAKMLKGLKKQIHRKNLAAVLVSILLTVATVLSFGVILISVQSYIPYSATQFEILEINGTIYARYQGSAFSGSVTHEPTSIAVDKQQKNVVIFYAYRTPLDSIASYCEDENNNQEHLIYLGKADEIDAIYYGEFDQRDPNTRILTDIQQAKLIWD